MAVELSKILNTQLLLEDFSAHRFIQDLWSDPPDCTLEIELALVILHYHQLGAVLRQDMFRKNLVSDFLFEKGLIFPKVTLQNNEGFKLLEYILKRLRRKLLTPKLVFYLDAPTGFLMERIRQWGRDFEARIGYDYLDRLNRAYREFMTKYKQSEVITLDAMRLNEA